MHYVVYKYLNEEDSCIYVGRTKVDIHTRIQQHKNGTEKEIKALSEATTIMYTELDTEEEMCRIEAVLIDLIRPKYNKQIPKYESTNLTQLKWREYKKNNNHNEALRNLVYESCFLHSSVEYLMEYLKNLNL